MRPVPSFACLALAFACLAPGGAWGQTGPAARPASSPALAEARALARGAMEHYAAGRWAEAIDGFQKADAAYPAPQYRIYLARAQAKLDRLATAARTYEAAITMPSPPDAPAALREAQAAAAAELTELRPRVPVLEIVVHQPAEGETVVTLDGTETTPPHRARLELDAGMHEIAASARGFLPQKRTVEMQDGATRRVDLTLEPIPVPHAQPIVTLHPAPEPAPPPDRSVRKPLGFALVGVGGAGIIVGAATGVVAVGKHGDLAKLCPGAVCHGEHDAIASYHTMATVSTIGFVAGGVIGAAGAVLLLWPKAGPAKRGSVAPVIGLGYAGVEGSFR